MNEAVIPQITIVAKKLSPPRENSMFSDENTIFKMRSYQCLYKLVTSQYYTKLIASRNIKKDKTISNTNKVKIE